MAALLGTALMWIGGEFVVTCVTAGAVKITKEALDPDHHAKDFLEPPWEWKRSSPLEVPAVFHIPTANLTIADLRILGGMTAELQDKNGTATFRNDKLGFEALGEITGMHNSAKEGIKHGRVIIPLGNIVTEGKWIVVDRTTESNKKSAAIDQIMSLKMDDQSRMDLLETLKWIDAEDLKAAS